jgi:hypothetical protein
MSSPTSTSSSSSSSSDESIELVIEYKSPKQVEELYTKLIDKYNDILIELEALEAIDDDIQELREKMLDKYEFQMLAEAYEAAGDKTTAEGLRNQSEEVDEKIAELQQSIENVDPKEHFMELYELEIQKETYEIQLKACEKYLERTKRKGAIASKKEHIRPASPRRYPKAASPSRLANDKVYVPTVPKAASPVKPPTPKKAEASNKPSLPKMQLLPPKKIEKTKK